MLVSRCYQALALSVALVASAPLPALAGPATDALGQCLVGETTGNDRLLLVRWMTFAFAAHPAVQDAVTIDATKVDALNRDVSQLVTSLLTDRCLAQTKAAVAETGELLGRPRRRLRGARRGRLPGGDAIAPDQCVDHRVRQLPRRRCFDGSAQALAVIPKIAGVQNLVRIEILGDERKAEFQQQGQRGRVLRIERRHRPRHAVPASQLLEHRCARRMRDAPPPERPPDDIGDFGVAVLPDRRLHIADDAAGIVRAPPS